MDKEKAAEVLREMRKWMRGEGVYTKSNPDTFRAKPYTDEEFDEALLVAADALSC